MLVRQYQDWAKSGDVLVPAVYDDYKINFAHITTGLPTYRELSLMCRKVVTI